MVQNATRRGSILGSYPLLLIPVVAVTVLASVHLASQESPSALANEDKMVDQNGDHVINAADLILLLEGWTSGDSSVSEMLQLGQAWQETDFNTPTATFTRTLCDTATFTLTPTEETEFDTPTPTLYLWTETPTATEETDFNTPTNTNTPTSTPVDQELYYYIDRSGKKKFITPSRTKITILLKDGISESERNEFIAQHPELSEILYISAISGTIKVSLSRSIEWDELSGLFDTWNTDPVIQFLSFVVDGNRSDILFSNSFSVLFPSTISDDDILGFVENFNVEILKPGSELNGGFYKLRPKQTKDVRDILRSANAIFESGLVLYSCPTMGGGSLDSITPNDPLFGGQWHLNNTGQDPPSGTVDVDIDAPEGWDYQTGSNNVVIAIIDSGIDMSHPDLDSNIWINANETENDIDDDGNGYIDDRYGWDFIDSDNNPPQDLCGHGTAVSGLAAAETNNSTGIAGVSWNCRLMNVKVTDADGNLPENDLDILAESIRYAVNSGADVINMSWNIEEEYNEGIASALQYARRSGRGGKGCVCVVSSGNDSGWPLPFPSSMDNVISVGASTKDDDRWWYSNNGDQLDIVAPSNGFDLNTPYPYEWDTLVTTDIQGSGGINTDGQDDLADINYTRNANGTSVACPQVAGLAALLLSQNPNLTAAEVQSLIQASADDLLWESWDELTGWGRINVYKALATATPGVSRFEIQDGDSNEGVAFDEFGFLYLSGNLKGTQLPAPYNTPIPTPNPNKTEFVILNASQTPVALVDIAEGDLYIKGAVNTRQPVPTPNPSKGEFYLSNSQATPVALINEDGNLYLQRQYYNESNP